MQDECGDLDHVVRDVLRGGGGGGELGLRMSADLGTSQCGYDKKNTGPFEENDPLTAGPRLEKPHSKLEVNARRRTQAEGDDRCKAFGGGHGTDAGYKSRCSGFRTGSVPRCFARCEAGS